MMNVGVLGTGMVGSAIASRLVGLGHEVQMGSREPGNEKAREWAEEAGPKASEGTFADAAAFGELVFNCTAGEHSIAALEKAEARTSPGRSWSTSRTCSIFPEAGRLPLASVRRTRSESRSSVRFPT